MKTVYITCLISGLALALLGACSPHTNPGQVKSYTSNYSGIPLELMNNQPVVIGDYVGLDFRIAQVFLSGEIESIKVGDQDCKISTFLGFSCSFVPIGQPGLWPIVATISGQNPITLTEKLEVLPKADPVISSIDRRIGRRAEGVRIWIRGTDFASKKMRDSAGVLPYRYVDEVTINGVSCPFGPTLNSGSDTSGSGDVNNLVVCHIPWNYYNRHLRHNTHSATVSLRYKTGDVESTLDYVWNRSNTDMDEPTGIEDTL